MTPDPQATRCEYVVTDRDGTSYCSLNQPTAPRIAELEAELWGWQQGADAEAREADRGRAQVAQLLRDLHSIEDIAHKAQPVYGEPYWQEFERIYRIAREAQATDEQVGPENNQIAT